MDFFGIGAAIKSMTNVYRQSARGTGRTTTLLDSVVDGDRIYFATSQEASLARRKLKELGKLKVNCMVVSVNDPSKIFDVGTPEGRAIFDHVWVEKFYEYNIAKIEKDIDYLERESSGYGYAHRETKRKAMEMSKWNF